MDETKKFSKLAIISFILVCIPLFIFLLLFFIPKEIAPYLAYPIQYFYSASFIFSIISLVDISEKKLKGKTLAIISLILSILIPVLYIIIGLSLVRY